VSTTRREFVSTGAASLVALAGAPAFVRQGGAHEIVIRGGTVFDGTGSPGVEADVAIANGRITAVGARLAGRGTEEIDARGLVVAPGFVDLHSHGDGTMHDDPRMESVVRQGITTIVVGQDGSSRAEGQPGVEGRAQRAGEGRGQRAGEGRGQRAGGRAGNIGSGFRDLFDGIDSLRPAVNVAS
jgi:N-acyl-D-aspartate/D-glutamate deacylase